MIKILSETNKYSCDWQHANSKSIFCCSCGKQINTSPEFERDLKEMRAWKKPTVGCKMQTPGGVVTVTHVTEYRWSGHSDKTGFGNVPFYESGNWRIFKVL